MSVNPDEVVSAWLTHCAVELGLSAHTLSNYRRDGKRYLGWLQEVGIGDLAAVTTADIENYVKQLRLGGEGTKPLAVASAARALVVVRGIHSFAVEEGMLPMNVAAEVAPPQAAKHLPDVLSVEQVSQLINAIPSGPTATAYDIRDRAVVELLYGTGCRVSELTGLVVDDVTADPSLLRVTGKGGKQRVIPVGSHAQLALRNYLTVRPSLVKKSTPALFLNKRGIPLSRQNVWDIIKAAAVAAGLPATISPHTLRHSYATHLIGGGANVRIVQELLGHAAVSTTQIYTHVSADDVLEVFATSHPRARSHD